MRSCRLLQRRRCCLQRPGIQVGRQCQVVSAVPISSLSLYSTDLIESIMRKPDLVVTTARYFSSFDSIAPVGIGDATFSATDTNSELAFSGAKNINTNNETCNNTPPSYKKNSPGILDSSSDPNSLGISVVNKIQRLDLPNGNDNRQEIRMANNRPHSWTISDFIHLKLPWTRQRWMAACDMIQWKTHGIRTQRRDKQFRFMARLLGRRQNPLDDEQQRFLQECVNVALKGNYDDKSIKDHKRNNGNSFAWIPEHRIFSLLIVHSCRFNKPDQAAEYLKHHIKLFSDGFIPLPPDQWDFQNIIMAWSQHTNCTSENAFKMEQLVEATWLPLYRELGRPAALQPLTKAYTACLVAFCATGHLARARDMLYRRREAAAYDELYPNTMMFNTVMQSYAMQQNIAQVKATFIAMQDDSTAGRNRFCHPNTASFGILMNALHKLSPAGDSVTANSNGQLLDTMINAYEKQAGNVHGIDLKPSPQIFATVISCYGKANQPQKATDTFRRMFQNDDSDRFFVRPNMHNYNAVLGSWARAANEEKYGESHCCAAKEFESLWNEFKNSPQHRDPQDPTKSLFQPDRFSYMSRINVWERSQRVPADPCAVDIMDEFNVFAAKMAFDVLLEMKSDQSLSSSYYQEGPPKLLMYNRVLLALARTGNVAETKNLLNEMLRLSADHSDSEIAPNASTLNFCIKACLLYIIHLAKSQSTNPQALQTAVATAEQAERWLLELEAHPSVHSNVVSYNTAISCWKESGAPNALERIWKLWHWMTEKPAPNTNGIVQQRHKDGKGLHPNSVTYRELLHSILQNTTHNPPSKLELIREVLRCMKATGATFSPQECPIHRDTKAFLIQHEKRPRKS